MPLAPYIDPDAGIAAITGIGNITGTEISEVLDALHADPEFQSGMAEIWDCRHAHPDVSLDDIRNMTAGGMRCVEIRDAGRTAIVASTDYVYGLAKQVQAYAERLPCEVGVFRQYENALEWVTGEV